MNTLGLMVALVLTSSASFADEFPPKLEAPAPASVWVTFDQADLAKAKDFPLSAPVATDGKTAIYKVRPEMLPLLSQFMHDAFHRCGGFLAHGTEASARASMRPSAIGPRMAYTLDQQAVVNPLVAGVKEANLRGTITAMAAYNNRYYTSDTGVEASRWLKGRWSDIAAKIPGASAALFAHDAWKQPSVILTIPGSEKPDEIVVLGGHIDSINGWGSSAARAPGADDNASGIAVLTETARLLAESGYRPKRTIQFMAYAAEEVGLRGSQDIAAKYSAAGKKVVGVIQFDMSNFAGNGDKIFLLTDNVDPALSAFTKQLVETYSGATADETECGYGCSDHASWTKKGYPASMAFEASFDGMNHQIHTENDTLATSGGDASHSVPFTKLALGFAVELAKTAPAAATVTAKN
jgi:leucyl aminopeptidase